MRKIFKVKDWAENKNHQFKMVGPGMAIRLKDDFYFSNNDFNAMIAFEGRRGNILEFMSDYVHVQIEVVKRDVVEYKEMEFDNENYEVIEVPINELSQRYEVISNPGR